MKVLHVMDQSLPKTSGYTIRAKYLIEAQARSGYNVTVLTSPTQGADAVDETIAGVKYIRSFYTQFDKKLINKGGKHLVFGKTITRKMKEIVNAEKFDIIHAHTPFTVAGPAEKVARQYDLPFVYEKRNLWEESAKARGKLLGRFPFSTISKLVDQKITRNADAVCVITRALQNHTIDLGAKADRVVIVQNGVDVEVFKPAVPDADIAQECRGEAALVIGFIGSFFKFEGLPLLVEAFKRLTDKHPDCRLVLVGGGEDEQAVKKRIDALAINDRCMIVGRVPHTQVIDYYASMDILVYPRYRSVATNIISPLKPLESMAMGKTVIGSDVGGISELIEHKKSGYLFRAGDCKDLAETLELFAKNPEKIQELGNQAKDYVREFRQWSQQAECYAIAYRIAMKR